MANPDITTEAYWRDEFDVSPDEETGLQEMFIQVGQPLTTDALATYLMERRLSPAARRQAGDLAYQPSLSYETGDVLHFPLLDNAIGKVTSIRAGHNPRYGDFSVITVALEGQKEERLFASDFAAAEGHYPVQITPSGDEVDPAQIVESYRPHVTQQLEAVLEGENFVRVADRWMPRIMLVGMTEFHANMAEAIIDTLGEAQSVTALLPEMGIVEEATDEIKRFSLEHLLSNDARFVNIVPDGESRWTLARLS